jgi:two-component system, chemotaxis family, chemotaxis protein CheY
LKRIVIADDSATARMFIKRCLEIIGFGDADLVEAVNGKEALAKTKEAPTDLVITDLNMPVMSGETLLKWIAANPKLNQIPVLVVSSAGNPAKEAELLALGAIAILSKPLSPPSLLEKLEPFLSL